MIKYIEINGIQRPAIVMDQLVVPGDVRDLRKALVDCLETCLSSETTKDFTKSTSLWYLVRLIDETTIDEKGGVCND